VTLLLLQVRLGFRTLLGIRDVRSARLRSEIAQLKRQRNG
jgi:hypothetical protein